MTVSAVAKLMPRPPARVDSKKQKSCDPSALKCSIALRLILNNRAIKYIEVGVQKTLWVIHSTVSYVSLSALVTLKDGIESSLPNISNQINLKNRFNFKEVLKPGVKE